MRQNLFWEGHVFFNSDLNSVRPNNVFQTSTNKWEQLFLMHVYGRKKGTFASHFLVHHFCIWFIAYRHSNQLSLRLVDPRNVDSLDKKTAGLRYFDPPSWRKGGLHTISSKEKNKLAHPHKKYIISLLTTRWNPIFTTLSHILRIKNKISSNQIPT